MQATFQGPRIPQSERPPWSRQLRACPRPARSPSEGSPSHPPQVHKGSFRSTHGFAIYQPRRIDYRKPALTIAKIMTLSDFASAEAAKLAIRRQDEEFELEQRYLSRSRRDSHGSNIGAEIGQDQVRWAQQRRARQSSSSHPARLVPELRRDNSSGANSMTEEGGRTLPLPYSGWREYTMGGVLNIPRYPLHCLQRSLMDRANVALPIETTLLEKELSILWGHIVFWHTFFRFRLYGFFHAFWGWSVLQFWIWGPLALVLWVALEVRDLVAAGDM
ncbi:MAG: hypothetical protein M1840_000415 [Geoglossum simile]|nr:MAG: hypothetical protein M1840_000415 [Geoglossum simile]